MFYAFPPSTYSHSFTTTNAALEALFEVRARYGTGVTPLIAGCGASRIGTRESRLRALISTAWREYLSAYDCAQRGQPTCDQARSTAAEIELTKKALVSGMRYEEITAAEAIPPSANGGNLSPRWAACVQSVLDYGFAQIAECARATPRIEYWMNFVLPNGPEDGANQAKRSSSEWDPRREALLSLAESGIALLDINGTSMLPIAAVGRQAVCTIPQFAYSSSWRMSTGTLVACHYPNARQVFPKKPIPLVPAERLSKKTHPLFIHSGEHDLVITNRKDSEVGLSASSFPITFAGPHLLARFFRAVQLAQQLTGYSFSCDIADAAALLANEALRAGECCLPTGSDGKAAVIITQHELFWHLKMDRTAGINLNDSSTDNAARLRAVLTKLDRTVRKL